MKHEKLKVEKRIILGKGLKKLRRDGIIPANVYGKNIKSESVQVKADELEKVYKETGETGLVDLELAGKLIPVLIHNVQKNFRGKVLHTDFFQVNLKEKVKAMVPLEIIGEPTAVTEKLGILMNIIDEIEVEALPESLPENIAVSIEHLANVNDQVLVSDLKVPEGVEILTDGSQVISKIAELITKEAAEEVKAEEEAAEAAKAEDAEASEGTVEGQVPAEGQEATTEVKQEETSE